MNNYADTVRNAPGYLYMLRRTIPPWRWRETLDELSAMCRKYRIDEVCVKIDTGTFTHYFPDEKWLRNYREILLAVKTELNAAGIRYSLNPNVTQGHGDRGRDICSLHPDWPMCTAPDGVSSRDCACNSGSQWRDYIRMQWRLYAETMPDAIWMEDDLRTFNHGPVGVGCFCAEHLRRFNAANHTNFSREELARRVFAPGNPDPLRGKWLKLLNTVTLEVLALCEKTVHEVSPDTVFGLMSSGPDMHAAEGRDWRAIKQIMSAGGRYPVLSRPPLGNYMEGNPAGLCATSSLIGMTRAAFGADCIEAGEIENYPYTGYAKSNVFTALQNTVAIASGNNALTLNLYDHCGTPMRDTEDILQSLNANKDFLSTLKKSLRPCGAERGVRVYFSEKSAQTKELPQDGGRSLAAAAEPVLELFKQLGVAATVEPEETAVTVLAGQTVRSAQPEELYRILSGGTLIDAAAFKALCDMGYSELLGAECVDSFILNTRHPLAGERCCNRRFFPDELQTFSLAIHNQVPLFTVMELHEGSEAVTEFVDPDFKRLYPGTFIFHNRLGGRIAVFPLELAGLGPGFRTPARKRWLHSLLEWAADAALPLYATGDRPLLPLRFDRPDDVFTGIFALSLDDIPECELTLHIDRPISAVERLNFGETVWQPFHDWRHDDRRCTLTAGTLEFRRPQFFRILYRKDEK
ncbi:MAG: hypothetical protein PHI85_03430 [Victivallaceae bacterium]|nr:hypothetical protein [Victivallaceae bacterium]